MKASVQIWVQRAVSIYVVLWIVEGAVRKWVPGTGELMYVARDVIAVLALTLLLSRSDRRLRHGWLLILSATALGVYVALQVIVLSMPLSVAILGLRSYVAPLLLLLLTWVYGDEHTVRRIGFIIIAFVPIQAAVAIAQSVSPASAWINREVVADSASFVLDGVARASGTFSAPLGLTLYTALAAAAVLSFEFRARIRFVLFGLVILTAGVSGSRGTILALVVVVAGYLYYLVRAGSFSAFQKVVSVIGILGIAGLALWAYVPLVVDTFLRRFEVASQGEDSGARLMTQTFGFLTAEFGVLGTGAGMNTQAGINAGSGLRWIEVDSLRWVSELGLVGFALAVTKLVLAVWLVWLAVFSPLRIGLTATLYIGALAPVLLYGSVTQTPSAQGFTAIAISVVALSLSKRPAPKLRLDQLAGRNPTRIPVVGNSALK